LSFARETGRGSDGEILPADFTKQSAKSTRRRGVFFRNMLANPLKTMPTLISLVAAIIAFRFLPHPGNVAPIGAFALIGGFYLGRRYALIVPFVALFLSDLFLNQQAGYAAFHWPRMIDWAAFLLIGMAALAVRGRNWKMKLATIFVTPFFFFAVSNFGVWLTGINLAGVPYAKTFGGLIECYVAGLPFLRGTMLGDWAFSALFIAVMHLAAASSKTEPAALVRR
jgi:hypothetical protein